MFCVFSVCCCLVVSTNAINCPERLVSEITCYVSSGTLNPTPSFTDPVLSGNSSALNRQGDERLVCR